jgi:Fe-S-cluster containining protein
VDLSLSRPCEQRTNVQRFSCTRCGACCNRSPETELSEAAALADVFVFRLMFRLHSLPTSFAQYRGASSERFYQSKRLLNAFAAHSYRTKTRVAGKAVEYDRYLIISALALDRGIGACSALSDQSCGIYERRPLACRTVPLRYSRGEAAAEDDLRAFVASAGYRCDTSESAPVVLEDGRIADPALRDARAKALSVVQRDRAWSKAIVRRMKAGQPGLPSLGEVEANASLAAVTSSMALAWRIAVETGLLGVERCKALLEAQTITIDREVAVDTWAASERETLMEMHGEYRQLLERS